MADGTTETVINCPACQTPLTMLTVHVDAPTPENAAQWASTLADHIRAEYGDAMHLTTVVSTPTAPEVALRALYAAALEAADYRPDMQRGDLADAVMDVRDRRMEQLTAGRDRLAARIADLKAQLADADAEAAEIADHNDRTCEAVAARDQLHALLGEAVDWIHEGELRDRICAALNGREQQRTHPFRQRPEADVRVCADCGKWPAHYLHASDTRTCGCDRCRA